MALLDRFRAQPRQKHADPAVRLAFVQEVPIDEREMLAEIAREDPDVRVRRAAVVKLLDPVALAGVAAGDADEAVRADATGMLRDLALEAFDGVSEADALAAADAVSDAKTLAAIAKASGREAIAVRALARITDAHALGSIARHAQLEPIRLAAFEALVDRGELLSVAMNGEFKETAILAVERFAERDVLEQIAARSRSKAAVKRARGLLRDMDERVAADAAAPAPILPVAPEELARREAERETARAAAEARLAADRAEAEAREADAAAARAALEQAQALEQQRRQEADREAQQKDAEQQARAAEAEERAARTRREALGRLNQLLARVETLAAKTDLTLKAGERALRDLREALGDSTPLPSRRDHDDIVQRLKAAHSALAPRVGELRDVAGWQRWANAGIQEQLCEKMEALSASDDPADVAVRVRDLQQQWRLAADVPRDKGELLWRRFKAAHDAAWARCESFFAAEAAARAENLARKIALCEKAESLADSTSWIQTADEVKRLQAEWKTIGAATQGQEKALWMRFRSACDLFFTRRQTDLVERKKVWADNLAKKDALCTKAEALAQSTDWDDAAAEIRRLQAEWKTIGPVRKTRSEAIWQRFRAACDAFFGRHAQRHDIARGERVAAREAICAELESSHQYESSAVEAAPPDELQTLVRGLRARWQQEIAARGVDHDRAAALDRRFQAAFTAVLTRWPAAFAGTELDADSNRKRMESLVLRMEALAKAVGLPSGAAAADVVSPTTRLAAMLKEALAANTIGGKVDDESRMRAAAEEARQAQASLARIGPVADDHRRVLAARFDRACRFVTDKATPRPARRT